jgi:hypothetical protein
MDKIRTNKQNNALHLMFQHLADELNLAGYDMRRTLRQDIDIPWNKNTVKEYLWRPVMQAQLQKDSTTEMTTKEIDEVFATLTRHLGTKLGVEIMFPSLETIINQQRAQYES